GPSGSYREPGGAHAIAGEPSPGSNVSLGVAVSVTHRPNTHSLSTISSCQFVTSTNTGVSTIDDTPGAGSEANIGASICASTRAYTVAANAPGADGPTSPGTDHCRAPAMAFCTAELLGRWGQCNCWKIAADGASGNIALAAGVSGMATHVHPGGG